MLWDQHGCVKGRGFDKSRRIGSIEDRIRLLERRDIDELILLDVSGGSPRFDEVRKLTAPLFCPITVGGGVKSLGDIGQLLACGADKVAINSAALERPAFVDDTARKFGSQAVVVSIDIRGLHIVAHNGRPEISDRRPGEWAREVESRGAGEILLTSIEHDGSMEGYDLGLVEMVARSVSIPVIACGGCGSYEHMKQALDAGAHAVAAGAMFQFRELTPKGASRYLNDRGYECRI